MLTNGMRREGKVRLLSLCVFMACMSFYYGCGHIFSPEPAKPTVKIVLDEPINEAGIQNVKFIDFPFITFEITFRWHIENPKSGVSYNYTLCFITQGLSWTGSPFSSSAATKIPINEKTEYIKKFSYRGFWEERVPWGVKAESSDGEVYESEIRWIYLHQGDVKEKVILDQPPDNSVLPEGEITFRWHIENARERVTYKCAILFDKGINPFDSWIETSEVVGEDTEYTKYMSADWWSIGFQWGVMVQSSEGYICTSEVRDAIITKK